MTAARRAVIIVGQGFEDSEFIYPFYRLQEADFEVDVATSNDKVVAGKHGIAATPTVKVEVLHADAYDLVVIPGGHEGPDRVRQVSAILDFVRAMNASGKVISSVCHGPWVLVSANILRGRNATSYVGCRDDLVNAGATWIDSPVVVDGNLVTSPHFRDNALWMKKTLEVCSQAPRV